MQFMSLPLPEPSVKERIVKNQELVFGDDKGSVSMSDVEVSTDGKVKYTQAVSDIDEDISDASGVVSSPEDPNMKVLLPTITKIAKKTEESITTMIS